MINLLKEDYRKKDSQDNLGKDKSFQRGSCKPYSYIIADNNDFVNLMKD